MVPLGLTHHRPVEVFLSALLMSSVCRSGPVTSQPFTDAGMLHNIFKLSSLPFAPENSLLGMPPLPLREPKVARNLSSKGHAGLSGEGACREVTPYLSLCIPNVFLLAGYVYLKSYFSIAS